MRTYRKRQALAAEFGCTLHMMDKITKGLRSYPERYPNAVISSGHFAVLDKEMVLDWIKYREALETGTQIPPFRREEYQ
jgi:hypothetical protein